jgi:putative membrane protein
MKKYMPNSTPTPNTADHLANERTFLSWIRTSIGIMAFGFVVVKFSLFVKQISLILGKTNTVPTGSYSGIIGIILVAVGAIVLLLSFLRYKKIEQQLMKGTYQHTSRLVTVLTIAIFCVSILLLIYLMGSI